MIYSLYLFLVYNYVISVFFKLKKYVQFLVTAAWREPIAGWVDNLNGPTGLMVGAGKGVIRTMHCNPDLIAEIVPVDVAINALIIVGKELGMSHKSKEPMVVNISSGQVNLKTLI